MISSVVLKNVRMVESQAKALKESLLRLNVVRCRKQVTQAQDKVT